MSWLRPTPAPAIAAGSRVLVNLIGPNDLRGRFVRLADGALVLEDVQMYANSRADHALPLDGTVVVPLAGVSWVQVLAA